MNRKLAARLLTLTAQYFAALADAVEEPDDELVEGGCVHPEHKRTPLTMGGKTWECECGYREAPK